MIETLLKIQNTLSLVETKGQNTILMANCLTALDQVIYNYQANQTQKEVVFDESNETV